jgi:hypothetical protein
MTHDKSFVDGTDARLQLAQEKVAEASVLREIARIAFVEVHAKDGSIELEAGDTKPDGKSVRVESTIDAREGSQRKSANDVYLRAEKRGGGTKEGQRLGTCGESRRAWVTCHGPLKTTPDWSSPCGWWTWTRSPPARWCFAKLRVTRRAMPTPKGRGDHRMGVSRRRVRSRAEKRRIRNESVSTRSWQSRTHEQRAGPIVTVRGGVSKVELPRTWELLSPI